MVCPCLCVSSKRLHRPSKRCTGNAKKSKSTNAVLVQVPPAAPDLLFVVCCIVGRVKTPSQRIERATAVQQQATAQRNATMEKLASGEKRATSAMSGASDESPSGPNDESSKKQKSITRPWNTRRHLYDPVVERILICFQKASISDRDRVALIQSLIYFPY